MLEHRPLLSEFYTIEPSEEGGKQARQSTVEINNKNDQQPQLGLVKFQTAEGSFKQPTEAEVSVLTYRMLGNARSHAQELSNEFARLLNRGSPLE